MFCRFIWLILYSLFDCSDISGGFSNFFSSVLMTDATARIASLQMGLSLDHSDTSGLILHLTLPLELFLTSKLGKQSFYIIISIQSKIVIKSKGNNPVFIHQNPFQLLKIKISQLSISLTKRFTFKWDSIWFFFFFNFLSALIKFK